MTGRDTAFMWETEALRTARRPAAPHAGGDLVLDDGWLTLREASEATGVPAATIRKWARHDNIPSFLEKTPEGPLRIVSLSGIRRWTNQIGREIETAESEVGHRAPEPRSEVDLTTPDEDLEDLDAPEGSLLVPLDAWNRMLNQLGNLHEAGQQLAEARERAAKAETEAVFLRERLRELRAEIDQTRSVAEDEPGIEPPGPSSTTRLLRTIYADWRRRRRK